MKITVWDDRALMTGVSDTPSTEAVWQILIEGDELAKLREQIHKQLQLDFALDTGALRLGGLPPKIALQHATDLSKHFSVVEVGGLDRLIKAAAVAAPPPQTTLHAINPRTD